MMLRALAESRERQARLGHRRGPRTAHPADVAAHQRRTADGVDGARCARTARGGDGRAARRRDRPDRGIIHAGGRSGGPDPRTTPACVVHEPVDLTDVVDRSLERVRRRRNDIEFDVRLAGWQVYGDGAGLSRAVLNLLDNAAKWSPPGGRVGVRLDADRSVHRRVGGVGLRARNSAAGARPGVRAVLPLDLGAGDAGLGARSGDRQAGRRETRWHASRSRTRSRMRDPPGTSIHVVLPGRLMHVRCAGGATRDTHHASCGRERRQRREWGRSGSCEKSGDVPNDL